MKILIDDLEVLFPYDYIYPEQYLYMCQLKKALDARKSEHVPQGSLLEMPSGTGKTISLLSVIIAYMKKYKARCEKLVYCSRTIPEIEKTVEELKHLIEYYHANGHKDFKILAVAVSSRKNLCIHPTVSKFRFGKMTDEKCLNLTAAFVRAKRKFDPSIEQCDFFENFYEKGGAEQLLPSGIYNLDDLRQIGKEKGWCPYFLSRHAIYQADVVVYSYWYLLDPKIAGLISKDITRNAVVVFDEAHNIDSVCIESMSVTISTRTVERCEKSLEVLQKHVDEIRQTDAAKLEEEYRALVQGLKQHQEIRETDQILANPVLPDEILKEPVPGTIRSADHFLYFLKRLIEYVKHRLRARQVVQESPASFLQDIQTRVAMDRKPLRFTAERLNSLLRALELTDVTTYSALVLLANFATLVSTYAVGFTLLIEPFDVSNPTEPDPLLHFSCLDASIAIKPVFQRFRTVVITSGTLSPLDMYPKMLNFRPVVVASFGMSLTRPCVRPIVVTKGNDQLPMTSKFEERNNPSVVRNYGNLLVDMARVVPDGIVCFFPSYAFMAAMITAWDDTGIMTQLQRYKLVFVETDDALETGALLEKYSLACEIGRGAVFLAVARGKISEGIDFSHHLGRAVLMLGIPYVYTESRILLARLAFLRDHFKIKENDFLTFDAMRQAAQCVGRALRSKTDYGIMIFADKRYARPDKLERLPLWLRQNINSEHVNLSTEETIEVVTKWLKQIAQPHSREIQLGVTLLRVEDLKDERKMMEMKRYMNVMDDDFDD